MKSEKSFKKRWQFTEYIFEEFFPAHFRKPFVYRFPDFADLNFKRGRRTSVTGMQSAAEQPADYLVTANQFSCFYEVKATSSKTSFAFKDIRPAQWKAATLTHAALGKYYFAIEAYELGLWFKVPASVFLQARKAGHKSVKFSDLTHYQWSLMNEYCSTL